MATSSVSADGRRAIKVAFAEDSYLVREAIHLILERLDGIEVVAICEDGRALWDAIEREAPDIVLTDVRMPPGGDEGIRIARQLRHSHPQVGVVVLSQYSDASLGLDLIEDGAEGRAYLLKERVHDPDELEMAIRIVARGGSVLDPSMVRELIEAENRRAGSRVAALTPRELEVLAEMAEGKSNAAVAESLVLTKRAVEKHVGSIFLKLGLADEEIVSRRVSAVLLFLAADGQ